MLSYFEVLCLDKKITDKKIPIIIAIAVIIILGLVFYILTAGTPYTSKGEDGIEISFNYPNGWAFQDRTPGVLIQGEKNGTDNSTNRSVVTINRIAANETSLDQIRNDNPYIKTGSIVNETNRTIDGVEAAVIDIDEMGGPDSGKIGEVKLVLFSKDDYIYTISFVTGGSIKDIESDINHILNSFHINKD